MSESGGMTSPPEPGSVLLVTGASSGIGLATAVAAAGAGFTVVATVRDLDRAGTLTDAAAAAGATVDVRRLDVTDADSVAGCVADVLESHGRLDALVNNAGAAHLGTVELDTMQGVRDAMEVNFFGVVAMTRAAMPHLRESRGRLVTISSVGGIVGQPFNEAYCAAKFAVEGFMEGLAPVAATVGVRVSVVEPGAVASSFVANAGVDPAAMIAAAGPYAPAMQGYLARTTATFAAAQSSRDAAAVVLEVLLADHPAFRTQTSDTARSFVSVKLADLTGHAVQGLTSTWVVPPAATA
jgi:NAD(P)-dependent dehydrogenase (short-subunit alcohol dehydrogenase family)